MKVGRKLANKLLNVTKFVLGFGPADGVDGVIVDGDGADRCRRSVDARQARSRHRRRDDRVRGVRLRTRARANRVVLLVVLRRLRRARQGPRLWLARRGGRGVGPHGVAHRARRLHRLFAPVMPFAVEEAWSWWHDHERAYSPLAGAARGGRRPRRCSTPWPRSSVRCAGPRPKPSRASGREVAELRVWAPTRLHAAIDAGRGDLADAGSILDITVHDGEQLRCEVVLSPSTRSRRTRVTSPPYAHQVGLWCGAFGRRRAAVGAGRLRRDGSVADDDHDDDLTIDPASVGDVPGPATGVRHRRVRPVARRSSSRRRSRHRRRRRPPPRSHRRPTSCRPTRVRDAERSIRSRGSGRGPSRPTAPCRGPTSCRDASRGTSRPRARTTCSRARASRATSRTRRSVGG